MIGTNRRMNAFFKLFKPLSFGFSETCKPRKKGCLWYPSKITHFFYGQFFVKRQHPASYFLPTAPSAASNCLVLSNHFIKHSINFIGSFPWLASFCPRVKCRKWNVFFKFCIDIRSYLFKGFTLIRSKFFYFKANSASVIGLLVCVEFITTGRINFTFLRKKLKSVSHNNSGGVFHNDIPL